MHHSKLCEVNRFRNERCQRPGYNNAGYFIPVPIAGHRHSRLVAIRVLVLGVADVVQLLPEGLLLGLKSRRRIPNIPKALRELRSDDREALEFVLPSWAQRTIFGPRKR